MYAELLMVEFNQTMYSGKETSGEILVTLNLLGGTAMKDFTVNILTSPISATGNYKHSTFFVVKLLLMQLLMFGDCSY